MICIPHMTTSLQGSDLLRKSEEILQSAEGDAVSDFVNGHILYVDGGILAYIGKQPK